MSWISLCGTRRRSCHRSARASSTRSIPGLATRNGKARAVGPPVPGEAPPSEEFVPEENFAKLWVNRYTLFKGQDTVPSERRR